MEDSNSNAGTERNDEADQPSSQPPAPQPIDEKLQKALDKALYGGGHPAAQRVRNFLNGTWLGEPLHVVLTDLPVGAWTVAMVFDALDATFDRREFRRAADASIAVGIAGAACAAATGLADWSDVDPPARRLGMIHGLLNLGGTALFVTSLLLRRNKARKSGRVAGILGYAVMSYAANLGGKMVYEHRVGVDRTNGQEFPDSYTAVMEESALTEGKPTKAMYRGTPILIVQRGSQIFAMADTCSHFGGPLSEGKLEGDAIVCPYHFSKFALEDGHVINGPAVHRQPCLEVRARDGQIEVRRPPSPDPSPL
jgi:nitrite reductase/ring-hydroxylating ferredoxin subunit/uncharacterized membrane protein